MPNFIKIEILAQVYSCDLCEVSKNTFSYRTPPVAASVYDHNSLRARDEFIQPIIYKRFDCFSL